MLQTRVIPVLLLKDNGLYKGVSFKNHTYIGDPVNTVKIFNDKEVDEIILLDINASKLKKPINYGLIKEVANETFMPLSYGGGIHGMDDVSKLFTLGVEKIILNSFAIRKPDFISEVASQYGSQSIIFSLDVKRDIFRRNRVYAMSGSVKVNRDPLSYALMMQDKGIGEIMLNSIDYDGCMNGYDLGMIAELSSELSVPLIVCGGAGKIEDFVKARNVGASAVAAGSFFVYQGPHKAVLISYPKYQKLCEIFNADNDDV